MHFLPGVALAINIIFTDMSIDVKHCWMSFFTAMPAYAFWNYKGSFDSDIVAYTKHPGTIYGFEHWDTKFWETVLMFTAGGLF